MNDRLDRFTNLLRQIFELDKSDLDFGIYRIMNLHKAEIEKFLTEGLPQKVQTTLAPFAQNDKEEIKRQMGEIEANAKQFGFEIASLPEDNSMKQKYADLQRQLASETDLAALETDVYSALYSFFNRYYDEGDFISKRRYKEGVYAIPYEGEEVKLYWANQDQYYIKTSENFKDYTFISEGVTVHFRLVDATTEQNNNKESNDSKRTFMLYTETDEHPEIKTFEYDSEKQELIIRFVFDVPEDKKRKYAEENYTAISDYLVKQHKELVGILLRDISTDKKKSLTVLEKHLKGYVAKNTFDYFIHKDLRGFLTRELDFYIKTEIMHLDDLDTENEKQANTYLAKIRAIKRVGKIIIDFLAQIEDFQKKLWLKKKFVLQTDWCMTLDKVDEAFWAKIIENSAQIDEWIAMYAIDEADGWSNPPTVNFLRQNLNLVIDTKHFSTNFKERLIASMDNLDEQTNGLLIRSDNFQALTSISIKYNGKISFIYIDPPYNTDASSILYKNNYKDSAWLSLMYDRIICAKKTLEENGVLCAAIDDEEVSGLRYILNELFVKQLGIAAVRSNPAGRKTKGKFAPSHEYALFYGNSENSIPTSLEKGDHTLKRFPLQDDNGRFAWANLIRSGTADKRVDRPTLFFPIYVNSEDQIRIPKMEYCVDRSEYDILEKTAENEIAVYPIVEKDGVTVEKRWQRGQERIESEPDEYRIRRNGDGTISIDFKTRMDEESLPITWWDDKLYASANYGAAELKSLFGKKPFDFAKSEKLVQDCIIAGNTNSSSIVLDFFAGSGTTGNAIIDLNRQDNGHRKYILIEMGEYFDQVTKPRMQKAAYCASWKAGKPQERSTGISQIIKYMRLESYEDALSNIDLAQNSEGMLRLFGDDYLINYMVDLESRNSLLNMDAFKTPFSYRMKITERNECRQRPVDICETFNYLVGLTVSHQNAISYYRAAPAADPIYEGAVDITEDIDGQYAFKWIYGTLPDGSRALIIWRTMSDDILISNAALDAYFLMNYPTAKDRAFDVVYVNCDSNLENLRSDREGWKVQLTETEFKNRMFEEA